MRSERVTAVRRLANGAFRRKVGRFLVEGPQGVREAVAHRPEVIDELFVDDRFVDGRVGTVAAIADQARAVGVTVTQVSERVLLAMTETVHPQGIAAVCGFTDVPVRDALGGNGVAVLLDRVRDPGNAGTVLRTADAAGARAVIFGTESVDPYNGKCVRATAGSLFHIPVACDADPVVTLTAARSAGRTILAATGDGETTLPEVLHSGLLVGPVMWVFGSEARGITGEVLAAADHRVSIPIRGAAESLNLAVAAGICLYAGSFGAG